MAITYNVISDQILEETVTEPQVRRHSKKALEQQLVNLAKEKERIDALLARFEE